MYLFNFLSTLVLANLFSHVLATDSAALSVSGSGSAGPGRVLQASEYWYEKVDHNGISPFIANGSQWKVFRNVKDYGAKGDGVTDDAAAIQAAVDDGGRGEKFTRLGVTGAPAVIYFPEGSYLLNSSVQSYVDTFFVGNPIARPSLNASATFNGSTLLYMKDPRYVETINFYIGVKNLALDSTAVDANSSFTLLDYSVSQGTQLTNVAFTMPPGSKHTGVATPEGGSGTFMGNLDFAGGLVGINLSNQQYSIKDCSFTDVSTAVVISHVFEVVLQGMHFSKCNVGINATQGGVGNIGSVTLIDSFAEDVPIVLTTKKQVVGNSTGDDSIVIDNLRTSNVAATVVAGRQILLTGSVTNVWVYGNAYLPGGPVRGVHNAGATYQASRAPELLTGPKYFTIAPPTYQDYSIGHVVNVKSVVAFRVYGDGKNDDTKSINAILANNAIYQKVTFFPAGTYLVSDTIIIPPGSRIVGEALSAISATGVEFSNATAPKPMVQVGSPGDKGVAQISDMLFTVADVLPGCILVEVNMAGTNPGDVGFWNSHIRVGGAAGSAVQTKCQSGIPCQAAFLLLHLKNTSSAYIEDMWGWTADHDLDGNSTQLISTGRGVLVESTLGTWLIGTAFEHNTLYQYSFASAANVLVSMQQSESPYWQGTGGPALAPAPWTPSPSFADPTFANCAAADANCRVAWYQRILAGSNLNLYGSGFWSFFNNVSTCRGVNGTCQASASEIVGHPTNLFWWNVNTKGSLNVLVDNGVAKEAQRDDAGSWGAVVAASLLYSGLAGAVGN